MQILRVLRVMQVLRVLWVRLVGVVGLAGHAGHAGHAGLVGLVGLANLGWATILFLLQDVWHVCFWMNHSFIGLMLGLAVPYSGLFATVA